MGKLIKCKACGKEVAKGSKSCPSCGRDNRSFFGKHKIITSILILVLLLALGGAMGSGDDSTTASNNGSINNEETTNSTDKTNVETEKQDSKVNYDNFIKVEMDMSYDDVVAILGDGTELSSSEIAGIKTTIYTWDGKGLSNMNVTIQNGVVTGKAQLGLKDMDAKVTLEQFNNVKEGMSYEEVVGILGEGEVISVTKIFDITTIMYDWVNKDGSNMNATFSSNSLSVKSQFNLK